MSIKLPEAKRSAFDYVGKFKSPAFGFIGGSPRLYDNLFNALSKYDTRPEDLKIESLNTSAATISFESLVPYNFVVRIRLDSVQITFNDLAAIGVEKARAVALDCWSALHKTDETISFASHAMTQIFDFNISLEEYGVLLDNFTKRSKKLPSNITTGVVYYFLPEKETDDVYLGGSIVLDRLYTGDLNLRISMIVDANKIGVPELITYLDTRFEAMLLAIGIEPGQLADQIGG